MCDHAAKVAVIPPPKTLVDVSYTQRKHERQCKTDNGAQRSSADTHRTGSIRP